MCVGPIRALYWRRERLYNVLMMGVEVDSTMSVCLEQSGRYVLGPPSRTMAQLLSSDGLGVVLAMTILEVDI